MAISMLKIRRPLGRLIFNMGIAIPGKTVFLIETAPRPLSAPLTVYCQTDPWKYLSMKSESKCINFHIKMIWKWRHLVPANVLIQWPIEKMRHFKIIIFKYVFMVGSLATCNGNRPFPHPVINWPHRVNGWTRDLKYIEIHFSSPDIVC